MNNCCPDFYELEGVDFTQGSPGTQYLEAEFGVGILPLPKYGPATCIVEGNDSISSYYARNERVAKKFLENKIYK